MRRKRNGMELNTRLRRPQTRSSRYASHSYSLDLNRIDRRRGVQSTLTAKDFPGLALPEPNPFVPQHLEIKNKTEVKEPAKRPLNLKNTQTSRLWYKKDDRWWVPRAATFFLFRSYVTLFPFSPSSRY